MRSDWEDARFGTMFCKKHDRHFLKQYACPECYKDLEDIISKYKLYLLELKDYAEKYFMYRIIDKIKEIEE